MSVRPLVDAERFAKALVTLVVFVVLSSIADAQDVPFLERDGVIAFEAESKPHDTEFWHLEDAIDGFSGTGYLVGKIDTFNLGGKGTIRYPIRIKTSGRYQLNWRSRIAEGDSNTEANDTFARVLRSDESLLEPVVNDNVKQGGDWYKVYMNVLGRWASQSSNKDRDPHSLSWNLEAGETYFFEISVRSKGHALDRIVLWDTARYSLANTEKGNSPKEDLLNALANSSLQIADVDDDGIPDSWEMEHGGAASSIDPSSDLDGDQLLAATEFFLGTDPNAFTSMPELQVDDPSSPTKLQIRYAASTEALQSFDLVIEHSNDLKDWSSEKITTVTEGSADDFESRVTSVPSEALHRSYFLRLQAARKE